jgi:hypothetical protein
MRLKIIAEAERPKTTGQQAECDGPHKCQNLQDPKLSGTTINRTVLSALDDASSVPDGLNASAVVGNECA